MITKMSLKRRPLAGLFCAATGLLMLASCNMPGGGTGNIRVGDELPAFYLKSPDGKAVSSDDLKGKPYVVAVFATWCPPCKDELTHFQSAIWEPLKDSGVQVMGINYGDEDADQIRQFADENNLTFPLLVDLPGDFRKAVGVQGVPTSFSVGKDGKVVKVYEGYSDEAVQEIKQQLTKD